MIEENFDKEDFLVPISGMYKEWFIDYNFFSTVFPRVDKGGSSFYIANTAVQS